MTHGGPSVRRIGACCVALLLTASACAATSESNDTANEPKKATGASVIPPVSVTRTAPTTGLAPAAKGSKSVEPGTYAVGSIQETYVDRTRKTQKNGTAPEKPERTLPTLVLYPAQGSPGFETAKPGAEPQPGPWPLVVFSHGVTGKGTFYATTLRVLASAGYVVVAPDYPLSNRDSPGGPSIGDVPAQTGDVAFLIDRALAGSKGSSGPLSGLIDPDRVGLAGHSLGAITSLGAGFNACCADARVDAVAEWAGVFFPLTSGGKVAPNAKGRPLLIVHGDDDGTVPYGSGTAVYKLLGAPKYFITLPGGGHVPPFLQGVGSPQSKITTVATINFFDRYLKGDKTGIDRMHKLVSAAGPATATVKEDPS